MILLVAILLFIISILSKNKILKIVSRSLSIGIISSGVYFALYFTACALKPFSYCEGLGGLVFAAIIACVLAVITMIVTVYLMARK